jgi:hypothetical protein
MNPYVTIVGTCSLCQGPVGLPSIWAGVIEPVPTCTACGAKKKRPINYGPIVEMEK